MSKLDIFINLLVIQVAQVNNSMPIILSKYTSYRPIGLKVVIKIHK